MPNILTRVGVLRGGPSSEYEVSMNSGLAVIKVIQDNLGHKYQVHDIFIDRNGAWHIDGVPVSINGLHHRIDIAFNALHGTYGEDGKVQHLLEAHGIPFTGSGSVGSAMGMNKAISKKVFKDHGIKSPHWIEIPSKEIKNNSEGLVKHLFKSFVLPGVVKPTSGGSSVGVSIIRSYDELASALERASHYSPSVILEEYISGIETTCGVIQGFRSQELYALPPVEIRPFTDFFDYDAKYANKSHEIVPATFSNETKREVEELARKIHQAFGLRHYSRSDFIIHPKRGIYALEVNTLPGLTKESLVPKALRAIGSDLHELVDHLLGLVRKH
ncbi:MAG: D-alanine--D-alanine ligase [Candidatus Paceibacterota bacterium]